MDTTGLEKIVKSAGSPLPLGANSTENGMNFALFSQRAEAVTLCLFFPLSQVPALEIPLDPEINKTGWVWHISLKNLPPHLEYGYKIKGPEEVDPLNHFNPHLVLSDPYALGLNTPQKWGDPFLRDKENIPRGKIISLPAFDWQGDKPPRIPLEDVIIYEMHVRSFTQHSSSGVKQPGTFLGLIEKIPHLKKLGVNAIELMPIFEFNECELETMNPITQEPLFNVWGYSTINFFAPMNRYASNSDWTTAIDEFRLLVREMHKNGIEVYLDVVYNHTAEGNAHGPTYSYRGIDNQVYYMLYGDGTYQNYSGTGNTFNANHIIPMRLILDSLRYWVGEMHVDGFRFDLASCLTRDERGNPLLSPPLIHAITHDSILAHVKLIAEAWDAGGLYQVGNFPGEGRWAEWNGVYRDVVRRFIKGNNAESGDFARVMCGSQHLYGRWKNPALSVNFVTAHDGFTLRDLVSYDQKQNAANGEDNRDGADNNDSWNCGEEGATLDIEVNALREKQMKNFHVALLLAMGTPMLLMSDEYGHTRNGNNNTYCQDNALNWFLWDELEKNKGYFRFYTAMIQFRKENPLLKRNKFLTDDDVKWHGHTPLHSDWGPDNRFVAYTLKNKDKSEALYIAFNAQFEAIDIHLPIPPKNKNWHPVVDTSLPSPQDFCENPKNGAPVTTHRMSGHSAIILKAY